MSDQRRTGAVTSLEEIFRSQEFGRRPARWDSSYVATVDPADPPQLEQLFLSDLFGHPEAIAPPPSSLAPTVPLVARPTLVLLSGRGVATRDLTRYRGVIGAVSGVAAAALVVAGMTSGTGTRSEPPTVSAQGVPPGHGSPPPVPVPQPGSGGVATQPNTAGTATASQAPATGGSAAGAPVAQLVSATTPVTTPVTAPAVAEVPPPAPVEVPPPPAPGGGTSPAPSPGGVLTPVFTTVGNAVSAVGSTVTAASNALGKAIPVAAPVTGLLGNVGATVTSLGGSVASV